MRYAAFALLATLFFVFVPGGVVLAQETQPAQALPDIAPRVVEIRGNLEISLPSLQRQPLVGFNPPPRVAPVPPDRVPFVEEYKQESVDLPPSPLTPPQPPPVASLIGGQPRNGMIEGTGGRYLSRALRFRSEWPLTDAAAVYSRMDYTGTEGHQSDAVEDVRSSSDALDALVGIQTTTGWATVGVELDGFLTRYRMYGAEPAAGFGDIRDEPPTREGRGGGAELWLKTRASTGADVDVRLRYASSSFETGALREDVTTGTPQFLRDETAIEVLSRIDAPLAGGQSFVGDLHLSALGFDDETVGSGATIIDGAGGVKFAIGRRAELTGMARALAFAEGDSASAFYMAPDVRLDVYPLPALRLYLHNRSRAEHHSTASTYRESPFVVDRPLIQPTLYTIDATAGTRVQAGIVEVDLHAGYSRAPNFRYFERATPEESGGYVRGMVMARYDAAAIVYVGGDVSVNLPAGFNATAGLTVRDGGLSDQDTDIPYFGPILGRGALSYSFLGGRGYAQAGMTYESTRYVNRQQSRKLGDYFDLDVHASYEVVSNVSAVLRMENLSAGYLERWEQYDQAPFVIGIGLQARW